MHYVQNFGTMQNYLKASAPTYLVHLIVGQLHLLEADDLLAELVRGEGRVRVGIVAMRRRRITLASHQPTGSVIRISEDR